MSPEKKNTAADAGRTADSNRAEYEACLPEIMLQVVGKTNISGVKPILLIDKGEKLYTRAMRDRNLLVRAGLPEDRIGRLKAAAGACRYAESELKLAKEYRSQWYEESPEGFALVRTLRQALLYALRDRPDLLKLVREMTRGTSGAAMVQQLQDCSTFGGAHKNRLEQIGFDVTLLDRAADLSAHLANLYGMTGKGGAAVEARTIRNKAYVYLKNLMMELRACGQYVFRNDPQHLAEYSGSLLPKKTGRRKNTATVRAQDP